MIGIQTLTAYTALLTLWFHNGVDAWPCPSSISTDSACPEGCYHRSDAVNTDGTHPCEPVGIGHYSGAEDNRRHPCGFGTYSESETATSCSNCPAGSHVSSVGALECTPCPAGTFSGTTKSAYCTPCDPAFYDGDGANAIQVWNGQVYCVQSSIPAEDLTISPTASPTLAATDNQDADLNPPASDNSTLTQEGKPALQNETLDLSESPEDDEDGDDDDNKEEENDACLDGDYDWHGECATCPSIARTVLQPIWTLSVIAGAILVLRYLIPAAESAVLWMGLEFCQLAYFVGLVPGVPTHTALDHTHQYLFSVFALDLDAGFSWQCLLGVSPALEQIWILSLPIILGGLLWVLSKAMPSMPGNVSRWIAIGVTLGHLKLIMTSLEALHCSGNSWFCHEPLLSSIAGIVGLSLYGVIFPMWLLWVRYSHFNASYTEEEDNLWSRDFAFTNCWWWPFFSMLRKSLLATLPFVLSDQPSLILTGILVTLMGTELIQRLASPMPAESAGRSRWFRAATVDTILQAGLIAMTGLSFMALAMPANRGADGLIIVILVLFFWISGFLYWVAAMAYAHRESRRNAAAANGTAPRAPTDSIPRVEESRQDTKSAMSASTSTSSSGKKKHRRGGGGLPMIPIVPATPEQAHRHHHDLSFVPPGSSNDEMRNIEAIPSFGNGNGNDGDEEAAAHETEWVNMGDSSAPYTNSPIRIPHSSFGADDDMEVPSSAYQRPLSLDGSAYPTAPTAMEMYPHFDDASTLTDLNTYTAGRHYDLEPEEEEQEKYGTSKNLQEVMMESSSRGNSPLMFVDDNDDDMDDMDDMTEVWIDEATGLPVDKSLGDWADASTGLPVESSSSQASSSSTSRRADRAAFAPWRRGDSGGSRHRGHQQVDV